MELTQAMSPYVAVSSTNFEKRFGKLLKIRSKPEIGRFAAALDELEQTKARLVAKFSNNPLIGYKVQGGLGAVCITCVEEYVTGILTKNGFDTQIMARELPYDLSESGHRLPGIHVYNVVTIGAVDFIVDLDIDPFVERNTVVVVAPLQADIPVYSNGFLYHCRTLDKTGRITSYKFSFEDEEGRMRTYLEGDTAEYLTIAPYHNASDQSLCPLCFAGGATIYFGFEKYYIGSSGPYYRIPFTLVCPVFPGEKNRTYQLAISDVDHIRVHRQEATIGEHPGLSRVVIAVTLTSGCRVQMLLASDGTLVANDFVYFVPRKLASPGGFQVRLSAKDGPKPEVILPRSSQV